MNTLQILALIGGLIILVLSIIASVMWRKVRAMEKRRAALDAERHAEALARRQQINQSIQIIARSLGQDERLTHTEASIRISGLLDSLSTPPAIQEEFAAFYQLTQATAHIPYLEQWQQLDKNRKRQLDRERIAQEEIYGEFVEDAARRIIGREF
jgi:hypothetical protein